MMFEQFGFYKEFYVNNKFVGSIKCEKDREVMGYFGRTTETTTEKIILENKKIIKANTEVSTMIFPLCGKQTN